jgi:hypothetical protein
MSRPPIGKSAMSNTERVRRWRELHYKKPVTKQAGRLPDLGGGGLPAGTGSRWPEGDSRAGISTGGPLRV